MCIRRYKKGKIYDIIEDNLVVIIPIKYDDEENGEYNFDSETFEYTKENIEKYANYEKSRWITIKDESSTDSFTVYDNDYRFILFENDKELAHELINRIDGFASTILNLAMYFRNQE